MKNSVKATLLNAFVLPGLGQLKIGRKFRGWLYIIITGICVIMLATFIVAKARLVIDGLDLSAGAPDMLQLHQQVRQHVSEEGSMLARVSLFGIVLMWIIALVDGIVTGRAMDRTRNS